jgi:hypothetical protein
MKKAKKTWMDSLKLGVLEKRKQQIDEASGWTVDETRGPTPAQKQDGTTPYLNRRRQEKLP